MVDEDEDVGTKSYVILLVKMKLLYLTTML